MTLVVKEEDSVKVVKAIMYAVGHSAGQRYWCVSHPSCDDRTHMVSQLIERADCSAPIELWQYLGPCDGTCHVPIPAAVATFLRGGPTENMQVGVTSNVLDPSVSTIDAEESGGTKQSL